MSDTRPAGADEFARWVERLWPSARSKGVSRSTFRRAFAGVTPDPVVIEKSENQPEFVKPIWDYMDGAVSDERIEMGAQKLEEHADLLARIEQTYGVDRAVIVAIWGLESTYGTSRGDMNVVRSLATLGYTGSRRRFGRTQLLAALQILQRGDIAPELMTGSWAGAMGHTQFIPTTYNAHAVDFSGDGNRDIWMSVADALASTANYLRASKWRAGETWGYEVALPEGFDYALAGPRIVKPLSAWSKLGIRRIRSQDFPRPADRAALIVPAGARGPAFLVLNNFRSILRYNNATAYALAVGHLSDRIRGFPPMSKPWPRDIRPLGRTQRQELQKRLGRLGYDTGGVDGIIGRRTRDAVRDYQRSKGLPPDGFPSLGLLNALRRDS